MKPKKIDRSTKKWRELYEDRLEMHRSSDRAGLMLLKGEWVPITKENAVKEAEEYADKLYQSLR